MSDGPRKTMGKMAETVPKRRYGRKQTSGIHSNHLLPSVLESEAEFPFRSIDNRVCTFSRDGEVIKNSD